MSPACSDLRRWLPLPACPAPSPPRNALGPGVVCRVRRGENWGARVPRGQPCLDCGFPEDGAWGCSPALAAGRGPLATPRGPDKPCTVCRLEDPGSICAGSGPLDPLLHLLDSCSLGTPPGVSSDLQGTPGSHAVVTGWQARWTDTQARSGCPSPVRRQAPAASPCGLPAHPAALLELLGALEGSGALVLTGEHACGQWAW